MVLGKLDSYMQRKNEIDCSFKLYTKISSKWIKDLTVRQDTIQLLE